MSKDYAQAEVAFTQAFQSDVRMEDAQRKMAYIYRSFSRDGQGNVEGAITDLDSAIAIDPEDLASYFDRMKMLVKVRDFDAVVRDAETVLSGEPDEAQFATAHYFLGRAYYGTGDFKASAEAMSVNLARFPEDMESLLFRASAKERYFDITGAIEDYDLVLELNPQIKEVYANRGVLKINLLTANGNLKPSKKEAKSACSDLNKAWEMGDETVGDMIEIYCK